MKRLLFMALGIICCQAIMGRSPLVVPRAIETSGAFSVTFWRAKSDVSQRLPLTGWPATPGKPQAKINSLSLSRLRRQLPRQREPKKAASHPNPYPIARYAQ